MKNKQLAEMIKRLRKEKQEELATTDINTTANMKGTAHDIVEYRSRSMSQPPARKGNLTPAGHMSHTKMTDITKAGAGVKNKYKPGRLVSEKKQDSNTKSTIINTTPEQDSAMVGTQ